MALSPGDVLVVKVVPGPPLRLWSNSRRHRTDISGNGSASLIVVATSLKKADPNEQHNSADSCCYITKKRLTHRTTAMVVAASSLTKADVTTATCAHCSFQFHGIHKRAHTSTGGKHTRATHKRIKMSRREPWRTPCASSPGS